MTEPGGVKDLDCLRMRLKHGFGRMLTPSFLCCVCPSPGFLVMCQPTLLTSTHLSPDGLSLGLSSSVLQLPVSVSSPSSLCFCSPFRSVPFLSASLLSFPFLSFPFLSFPFLSLPFPSLPWPGLACCGACWFHVRRQCCIFLYSQRQRSSCGHFLRKLSSISSPQTPLSAFRWWGRYSGRLSRAVHAF